MANWTTGLPPTIAQDYMRDPRLLHGQLAYKTGSDTSPVLSPLQGLARALQGGLGGYQMGLARKDAEGRGEAYRKTLADALSVKTDASSEGGEDRISRIAQALSANPDTADLGFKLTLQGALADAKEKDPNSVREYEYAKKNGFAGSYQDWVTTGKATTSRPAAPIQNFAERQRLVQLHGENSKEVKIFDNYVRALQVIQQGPQTTLAGVGGVPEQVYPVGTKPQDTIDPKTGQVISTPGRLPNGGAPMAPGAPPQAPGGLDPMAAQALAQEQAQQQGAAPGAVSTQRIPPSTEQVRAATNAFSELSNKTSLVTQDIDRALAKASGWTTGMGAVTSGVPGTPAHDLANILNTIKSNVGFDQLQAMRASSPTGGALGQVSERENTLLQSVMGALEQSQSAEQFKFNLTRLKEVLSGREARMKKAFDEDFGGGGKPSQSAPSQPRIVDW